MTLDEARAVLRVLAVTYPQMTLTQSYVEVWHRSALRDVDVQVAGHVLDKGIERWKWPPRPADFVELYHHLYPDTRPLPLQAHEPASETTVQSYLAEMRNTLATASRYVGAGKSRQAKEGEGIGAMTGADPVHADRSGDQEQDDADDEQEQPQGFTSSSASPAMYDQDAPHDPQDSEGQPGPN